MGKYKGIKMKYKIDCSNEFLSSYTGSVDELKTLISSLQQKLESAGSVESLATSITFGSDYNQIITIKI